MDDTSKRQQMCQETHKKLDHYIKKGAYYYRANKCGYTTEINEAGLYTKEDAEREASVEPWHMRAIPIADIPQKPNPYAAHIAALEAELADLRKPMDDAATVKALAAWLKTYHVEYENNPDMALDSSRDILATIAPMIREREAEARRKALEEAASVASRCCISSPFLFELGTACADAIRALIKKTATQSLTPS